MGVVHIATPSIATVANVSSYSKLTAQIRKFKQAIPYYTSLKVATTLAMDNISIESKGCLNNLEYIHN